MQIPDNEYFPRLSHISNVWSITLREDYLRFCDGFGCAAMLLEIFGDLHETNVVLLELKRDNILGERKKFVLDESDLYLSVNLNYLAERLVVDFEPEDIEDAIDFLVEKGALKMVIDKDGMDHYILMPDVVNEGLFKLYGRWF